MLTFTNEVYPKMRPVIQHVCKEFVEQSEKEFLAMIQADGIKDELESQELCLLKHDYLSDLKAATE